jgi:hypothetical protein
LTYFKITGIDKLSWALKKEKREMEINSKKIVTICLFLIVIYLLNKALVTYFDSRIGSDYFGELKDPFVDPNEEIRFGLLQNQLEKEAWYQKINCQQPSVIMAGRRIWINGKVIWIEVKGNNYGWLSEKYSATHLGVYTTPGKYFFISARVWGNNIKTLPLKVTVEKTILKLNKSWKIYPVFLNK